MVPTYLTYLTTFISRNSSQSVDTQSNKSWQLSLPHQIGPPPRRQERERSSTTERTKQPLQNHHHKRTEQGRRKSGPVGSLGITELCSQQMMGSTAIANRKPLAGQPCLTPLAMGNCHLVFPANSTCGTVAVNHSEEPTN